MIPQPKPLPLAAERPFDRVAVVGLGYVGLPTAATIASRGISVAGIDVSRTVVETINRGAIHIVEPRLDLAVKTAVISGHLRAHLAPVEADAFLIAVPTPITDAKAADISMVLEAARAISGVLKSGDLVVLESTSPVGTTERVVELLRGLRPDLAFPTRGTDGSAAEVNVAYCPERVLPGRVMDELVHNERAIGGMTPACTARAKALYARFVSGDLLATDTRSAELCKLAENAFRDVNVAFANELANVCDVLDIDVWEVIGLANRHPRVDILKPGPGVGGHCIAVDPWFIVEAAPEQAPLIATARRVNDARPGRVAAAITERVAALTRELGREPVVALFGLAFKPDIDDLRESPAVAVAERLCEAGGCKLLAVEPNIRQLPAVLAGHPLELVSIVEAMVRADLVAVLVNHFHFARITELRGDRSAVMSFCRP